VARLTLDTSVLIEAERGRPINQLGDPADDIAIAAISAAELFVGVQQSRPDQREQRLARVEALLTAVTIDDYDVNVARVHAALISHVRQTGRSRGAHDLIIAATARANDRTVVTFDRAGFADLPGVEIRAPR
jgi:tRNA(fMet)-specific endonuclease VapC